MSAATARGTTPGDGGGRGRGGMSPAAIDGGRGVGGRRAAAGGWTAGGARPRGGGPRVRELRGCDLPLRSALRSRTLRAPGGTSAVPTNQPSTSIMPAYPRPTILAKGTPECVIGYLARKGAARVPPRNRQCLTCPAASPRSALQMPRQEVACTGPTLLHSSTRTVTSQGWDVHACATARPEAVLGKGGGRGVPARL